MLRWMGRGCFYCLPARSTQHGYLVVKGVGPGPGPLAVPADQLPGMIGVTNVRVASLHKPLQLTDYQA